MSVQALAPLALILREHLDAGDLAGLGRVEMSDGMTVDPERMARIVLVDIGRIGNWDWLTDREEQDLHDDLLRLLALVNQPIPAYRAAAG